MQKYCFVQNCRYPEYHLTSGHRCACGKYGHGQMECGSVYKINALTQKAIIANLKLPENMQCTVEECDDRHTHTIFSHVCLICNQREHGSFSCPQKNTISNKENYYNIQCPTCKTDNYIHKTQKPIIGISIECIICHGKSDMFLPQCGHVNICLECIKNNNISDNYDNRIKPSNKVKEFDSVPDRIFTFGYDDNHEKIKENAKIAFGTNRGKICLCSYAGMGCYLFIRRNDIDAEIEIFFMHSDSWGQYEYSEVGELNAFVEDYEPIWKSNV